MYATPEPPELVTEDEGFLAVMEEDDDATTSAV